MVESATILHLQALNIYFHQTVSTSKEHFSVGRRGSQKREPWAAGAVSRGRKNLGDIIPGRLGLLRLIHQVTLQERSLGLVAFFLDLFMGDIKIQKWQSYF